VCGELLPVSSYYAGRKRLYCSNRCKQKAKWERWKSEHTHFVSNTLLHRGGTEA